MPRFEDQGRVWASSSAEVRAMSINDHAAAAGIGDITHERAHLHP